MTPEKLSRPHESKITTFSPSTFFFTGKGPESRPESLEESILRIFQGGPLSKSEISQALGHKHISGGLKKALNSLMKQERITLTIPEKPNSRLQKYQLCMPSN